jgi:uncharacterized membrane protein YeiH
MSLIKFIEIIAILVGAFSGFIEARRKRMDLVGVFTVAFITAFGGARCSGSSTRNTRS